jgi:hypothetical protein
MIASVSLFIDAKRRHGLRIPADRTIEMSHTAGDLFLAKKSQGSSPNDHHVHIYAFIYVKHKNYTLHC